MSVYAALDAKAKDGITVLCFRITSGRSTTLASSCWRRQHLRLISVRTVSAQRTPTNPVVMPHAIVIVCYAIKLDVSRSIARILQNTEGNLLTLGAFTLELELDIVEASSM